MNGDKSSIAQSVRQRLLNLARKTGQDYNRLLVRYALERLLYRLSVSEYRDRFILKGAMLFAIWSPEQQYRTTQDLDLLGIGSNSPESVADAFRAIARTETDTADGMVYLPDSVTAGLIREDMEYEGVRVAMDSTLGTARIALNIDIGFGDAISPPAVTGEYPVLFDSPAPTLRMYQRETAIAEKLHAMVERDVLNSRMKDFADIWYLAQHFDFDGPTLANAIAATFSRRDRNVPAKPVAFTSEFAQRDDKQTQWRAFLRRTAPEGIPADFTEIVAGVAALLGPITAHLAGDSPLPAIWNAPGPWVS